MKPSIRFNGFSDEWVEKKLGDVVGEIQSGNRLPKNSLTNGNVPYVVAQTKNNGVFMKIARGTLDYNGKPMKLFPGNSISFSIDNPEAMFYRNAEFYASNIMRVIHEDHLTREQYVFILENMRRFIREYDWSHKFSGPVVSNLEYSQPSEEEQQKIGALFSKYDTIIALREQKLEELNALKKGLLQQMFPKDGAKVPELRFAGFVDDWVERKLGEVIDIENGYAFKSEYFSDKEKRHVVLTPGSVKIGGGFQKDKGRYYDVSGVFPEKFIFKPGDIFITMTDLTPTAQSLGYPAIVPRDDNVYLHNQRLGKIINTTTNQEFLYTLLTTDTYHREIVSSASGTTVKHSSVSKILDFKSAIPNIDEQQKIGQLFKQLDTRISNEQSKIEQLKTQKQGLLQRVL